MNDPYGGVVDSMLQIQAEQALKNDSRLNFSTFFSSAPIGIALVDRQLNYTTVNPRFCEIFNAKREAVAGKPISESGAPLSKDILEIIDEVLETGEEIEGHEAPVGTAASGKKTYCSYDFFPVKTSSGEIASAGIFIYDVSEQQRAKEAHSAREDLLQDVLNSLFAFVGLLTPDGILIDINKPALDSAKLQPADVLYRYIWDAYWWSFAPESQERLKRAVKKAASGKRVRYDVKVRIAAKKFIHIDFSLAPVFDKGGAVKYLVPSAIDISSQKQVEEALQLSKKRFNVLVDSKVIGAIVADLRGKIYDANDAFLNMLDYSREDLKAGKLDLNKITPGDYFDEDQEAIAQYLDKGYSDPYEKEYFCKSGARKHVVVAGSLVNRQTTECIAIVLDISEQKQYEDELQMNRDRFQYIADNMVDVISIRDSKQKYIYVSPMIEKITGATATDFIGKTQRELGMPDSVCSQDEEALAGVFNSKKPASIEFTYKKHHYHSVMTPEFDKSGNVVTVLTVSRDITVLKEEERKKDEFISAASHELKTPVTSLKIFTQLLQRLVEKNNDEDYAKPLAKMDEQIDRLTVLINDILDVSRMKTKRLVMRMSPNELEDIAHEAVMHAHQSNPGQQIIVKSDTRQQVTCDRGRILQVIVNLLTNAMKYSPVDKEIIIDLKLKKDTVVISVRDYGSGINKAHQDKIFELFYRVKDNDRQSFPGLGTGLFIAHEIVKQHHGRMWVDSKLGKGSTFYFELPIEQPKI